MIFGQAFDGESRHPGSVLKPRQGESGIPPNILVIVIQSRLERRKRARILQESQAVDSHFSKVVVLRLDDLEQRLYGPRISYFTQGPD